MRQRYHVLLRTGQSGRVLADCRAIGWLLPIVTADASVRAPHAVSHFLERLQIDGTTACVTAGMLDADGSGIDWLAVVDDGRGGTAAGLRERTVAELLTSHALLAVQHERLCAYARLSPLHGSSLEEGWLPGLTAWAMNAIPPGRHRVAPSIFPHRSDLFEAVHGLRLKDAVYFLKWRGDRPFTDPDVAAIVGAAGPACAPDTIAYDRSAGCWLTDTVRGVRLTAELNTQTVGRVAEAMALTQLRLVSAGQSLRSAGVRDESVADLARHADQLLDLMGEFETDRQAAQAAIRRACETLDALQLPATWVHTDFVPENVFVGGERVSFIDFDDAWIGPAPVVLEFLFSGLRRHVSDAAARQAMVDEASERFVRAWRPLVPPDVMRRAFASTRLVAELLRITRRLRVLELREQRGDLVGLHRPASRESLTRLARLSAGGPRRGTPS